MSNTTPATVAEGLRELADRCERASGPDRDLNADILVELGYHEKDGRVFDPTGAKVWQIPDFTASLDAAMTLVPEGWHVAAIGESLVEGAAPWSARLYEARSEGGKQRSDGGSLSAALALCAAALRARAHIQEQP